MNVQSRFLQWKEQVKDGLLKKELSALSESQIKERFYKDIHGSAYHAWSSGVYKTERFALQSCNLLRQ